MTEHRPPKWTDYAIGIGCAMILPAAIMLGMFAFSHGFK